MRATIAWARPVRVEKSMDTLNDREILGLLNARSEEGFGYSYGVKVYGQSDLIALI